MSNMRRGHRLHSISGLDLLESTRFLREESCLVGAAGAGGAGESRPENDFLEALRSGDHLGVREALRDPARSVAVQQNWNFVRKCVKEAVGTADTELIKAVLEVLTDTNPKSFDVGEIFVLEALASGESRLIILVLEHWITTNEDESVSPSTDLDVIHSSVYFASHRGKLKEESRALQLLESAIYCATVDQQTDILEALLSWHEEQSEWVGQSIKLNADCMIHAALEEDRERLSVLYSYGYRLGTDTDRRINKDYLKRIKLFKARASPVYKSVVFETSKDMYKDDPLKKCFEYARQARINADKIQDFTKEYMDIAKRCEEFAKGLLDRCTTKHEVQTLLQTRSYKGHMDANFNIAILDGHKEFVAHEKFQQLLHKKWGQRDRLQWGDGTPGYNIFWSEMTGFAKSVHVLKQVFVFLVLPIVYLLSMCSSSLRTCKPCNWFLLQSQIPVNRFLYWEISKLCFYTIVLLTLVDDADVAWYDILSVFWILSYLLENFRTIHRLYRYGGTQDRMRVFKRWLTFRNIYILSTDIVFLISVILRCVAYFNDQCRLGCPYEGNEIAFVAAAIWSVAALLTFLRSIQGGLMWRQTGPVIISISYMILDVLVFLFIFIIVYLAFTVVTVYIYKVYSDDRTQYFNDHKSAFKYFFWAMIRTGNPQFADIYVSNTTAVYNATCLREVLRQAGAIGGGANGAASDDDDSFVAPTLVKACRSGHEQGEIEEEISYVAGNTLWAFYQFSVVIVLLSILRARMVNTYHRVFKEADVQWKYFRASIWWKYLDKDSVLPPPFTALYFMHQGLKHLARRIKRCQRRHLADRSSKRAGAMKGGGGAEDQERRELRDDRVESDRREFERRYRTLMLMLIAPQKAVPSGAAAGGGAS